MPANKSCFASADLCLIRTAKIDASGAPSVGASNGYVSDGMQKLQVSVNIQKGNEFTQVNGCGAISATFKEPDQIKWVDLSLDVGILDLILLHQIGNCDVFPDTGSGGSPTEPMGFQLPAIGDSNPSHACFEAWSKLYDGDSIAVPGSTAVTASPPTAAVAANLHWVFPNTYWILGQFTLDNGIAVFPLTGVGVENSAITANGPFDDWPAQVIAGGGVTRCGGAFFDPVASMPSATCSEIAVPTQT